MTKVVEECKPNLVFVQGDTTSTFAAGLAAFYRGIPVCHVEAGLRTRNKKAPFPEEVNRRITSVIADYHFAPTESARQNLLSENVPDERIFVVGNTVVDALQWTLEKINNTQYQEIENLKSWIGEDKKLILVTGHRRENFGEGFEQICEALKTIAETEEVEIVYPVHLNPAVQSAVSERLSGIPNIHLIPPVNYPAFVWLMQRSHFILTDSGGIQEEAPALGKPILLMRQATERAEAIDSGNVILTGTDPGTIINAAHDLLHNQALFLSMSQARFPFGDGTASQRIVEITRSVERGA